MPPKAATNIVKIAGRNVTLRYDFNAADALDLNGINLFNPDTYTSFSPSKVLTLVWAGQLHQTKPLTREQVAKELSLDTELYSEVASACAEAIRIALTEKK